MSTHKSEVIEGEKPARQPHDFSSGRPWSASEDRKVLRLKNAGKSWEEITEELEGRSRAAVKQRFWKYLNQKTSERRGGRRDSGREFGAEWSEDRSAGGEEEEEKDGQFVRAAPSYRPSRNPPPQHSPPQALQRQRVSSQSHFSRNIAHSDDWTAQETRTGWDDDARIFDEGFSTQELPTHASFGTPNPFGWTNDAHPTSPSPNQEAYHRNPLPNYYLPQDQTVLDVNCHPHQTYHQVARNTDENAPLSTPPLEERPVTSKQINTLISTIVEYRKERRELYLEWIELTSRVIADDSMRRLKVLKRRIEANKANEEAELKLLRCEEERMEREHGKDREEGDVAHC
ncbi:hypothetical protein MNV49_005803 [Pseudohyphozyma bogoriensis]|nr:hypothetical protein MNV49_005803 [Pseudohyphozyma bogoriensis]